MISIPEELEQQVVLHETSRDDVVGARSALETLVLSQIRAIADGLLADFLLRGESFDAQSWWHQFLSRQQLPSKYFPDLANAEFRLYRKDFAQRIASQQITRVSLNNLPTLQIRILGGYCPFYDEGQINRQLIKLGSSLRLVEIGSSHYRTARMRSLFGRQLNDKLSLDGRFILGRIGPASVLGSAALYLFEREFALSPYMESMANGFTDEARIVVRQDVLRGEIEQEIQKFQAEKSRSAIGDDEAEETMPFTVSLGELRKALEGEEGNFANVEKFLHIYSRGVLMHESGHVVDSGATISSGTSSVTSWRQATREDLLRFAQKPCTLDEFRAAFDDYFHDTGLLVKFYEFSDYEHGYTVKEELEALCADGLLFVDRNNRYYSKLYSRGQPWSL